MEIKANYILIGAFTLAGLLAGLGFLVWLAGAQLDRRYALYDIYFDSVSGLSPSAEVRFDGLPVGQVIELDLAPEEPGIRARIEVQAETPIKTDTVAQLQSQGVTGVGFVSLDGGSPEAPLLAAVSEREVPVIESERSVLQTLTEDAPDLVTEAIALLQRLQGFAGPENQARVGNLLENLSQSSNELETALSDFSAISEVVARGTQQITTFTGRLEEIGATVESTLETLDATLVAARGTIAQTETTLETATEALAAARETFQTATAAIDTQVPRIAGDVSSAFSTVESAVESAMGAFSAVAGRFGATAEVAEQRLVELGGTLAAVDATLADASTSFAAVEEAAEYFDQLIETEGTALVSEARSTVAAVDDSLAVLNDTLVNEVPPIVSDVRSAVAAADRVIGQVEAGLAELPERLEPLATTAETTLATATETLERSQATLARLDSTLTTADETLSAAEGAFTGAERIIGEEVEPAMADLRAAAGQVEETSAALAESLPGIAADLRETAARARAIAEQVEQAVDATAPPIRDFAERGLPQFTRFADEAQDLVSLIENLVRRIERDPARFFFGDSTPEFRR